MTRIGAMLGYLVLSFGLASVMAVGGQSVPVSVPSLLSRVWSPDVDAGHYRNPVLYADYSDPDVLRVGDDFYLVASSFNMVPGLPILHSRDLVHWEILTHVFAEQQPADRFRTPQHGAGAWAPALRRHAGEFFIFYPDPDVGIYMTKAKNIAGPWTDPILVKGAPGWIDPCPFWDDDGRAYLVNGVAASRRGVKGALLINRMAADGTHLLDEASILIDGHAEDPTLEGPKIYKRHGWYYVFAPAGGVSTGWQLVFRSRNIYGPYERRVVLNQGATAINGPHQGAWVETSLGEDWFLHFQDQGPYGRVVHLEPMHWKDDWPSIGFTRSGSSIGEPVAAFRKPRMRAPSAPVTPADSDEFNGSHLGLQWQWQANPEPNWAFPSMALGALRLICVPSPSAAGNLWKTLNVLLQKFPGPEFSVTTKVTFHPHFVGEEIGLVIMGQSYAALIMRNTDAGLELIPEQRPAASQDGVAKGAAPIPINAPILYLRATVVLPGRVGFSYSVDGTNFIKVGDEFMAQSGRWIGATVGIYATAASLQGELGYADFDWFRFDRP